MPTNQDLIKFIEKMRDAHALLAMNTRNSDSALPLVIEANEIIELSKSTSIKAAA